MRSTSPTAPVPARAFAAALALVLAGAFAAGGQATPAHGAEGAAVAVLDFDYSDSSGEPGDQEADHARRLEILREGIGRALEDDPDFQLIELPCSQDEACSAADTSPEALLAEAREAQADYLVFGSIHKMSSLLGGGRVFLLDVARDRLLMDRVLNFRGDSDEAFRRAADFASRDIIQTLDPSRGPGLARREGIR